MNEIHSRPKVDNVKSAPPTPAGWFDDVNDTAIQRYWDGSAWTEHTAPKSAAPVAAAGMSKTTKGVLIGVGAFVGLIVLVSVAAAAGGARTQPVALVAPTSVSVEEASPTPTPTITPSAPPVVVAPVVDVAAFQSNATRDLNDFAKDLDDMVVTVNEGGFWRLLSNSLELSFNLGQLQSLDAPASVSSSWAPGLAALEVSITTIDDAVAADDSAAILAAIEASRGQVNALLGLVASAT